jgi:hypothetical protein
VTFLLLLFGRIDQRRALLTGGVLPWGRKPWLAQRMREVLRNP